MILEPERVKTKSQTYRPPRQLASQLDYPPELRCIVLVSGGMDSATTLAYAVDIHGAENTYALVIDYGQRHQKELDAAAKIAEHFNVKRIDFKVDLGQIGGSALTDNIPLPAGTEETPKEVPVTYVPARNTIFLAIAAAYAEKLRASFILYGANYIDSGGYPDCRPEFISAMNGVMRTGTKMEPGISSPLVNMTKKEIVEMGEKFHVPWEKTWSCYAGLDDPCGQCNACVQRAKGFKEAGVVDPLVNPPKGISVGVDTLIAPRKDNSQEVQP